MKKNLASILMMLTTVGILLLAAGCDNAGNPFKRGDQQCIITPQLKKALKDYDICGVGDGYIVVGQKNKQGIMRMGCMNMNGKIILPVRYSSLSPVGDDLLISEDFDKNKKFRKGCINLKGKQIIPYKYDVIREWGDYFIVRKEDNKYGILDNKGKEVVPIEYDGISPFYPDKYNYYEGSFYLEKNGDLKVVNLNSGKKSKPGKPQDIPFDYHRLERNGKCGFVNYLGEEIPCVYQDARKLFSEGYAAVVMNNKVGFIDTCGNVKIPCQFDYSKQRFQDGKPVYSRRWKSVSINEYHNEYYYGVFSEGYASMMKGGKYGYIDKNGNTVIPFTYSWASPFHQGAAVVEKKTGGSEKYGLIGKDNNLIMPITYDGISYDCHGKIYCVLQNGKYGVYSAKGECLSPCQYDFPGFFFNNDGYSTANKNGKQGLIDRNGMLVIPCDYDICSVLAMPEGVVQVSLNDKWGLLDVNNNVLVPVEFNSAGPTCIEGLFSVEKDGRKGLYDRCGNCTLD